MMSALQKKADKEEIGHYIFSFIIVSEPTATSEARWPLSLTKSLEVAVTQSQKSLESPKWPL